MTRRPKSQHDRQYEVAEARTRAIYANGWRPAKVGGGSCPLKTIPTTWTVTLLTPMSSGWCAHLTWAPPWAAELAEVLHPLSSVGDFWQIVVDYYAAAARDRTLVAAACTVHRMGDLDAVRAYLLAWAAQPAQATGDEPYIAPPPS